MGNYIGVDGGGTKTIVALFNEKKELLDQVRTTGSNHENLEGSFEEAGSVLMTAINELLSKNSLGYDDIDGCLMGLAGIDHDYQRDALSEILAREGLKNYRIYNDGFIITKAGLPDGIGIGYNCGTGTCCNSIDNDGTMLQIGGFDTLSQDKGNGHWIAKQTFTAVYDDVCLAINKTSMTEKLFAALKKEPSRETVLEIIPLLEQEDEDTIRLLIDVYFEALNSGDEKALAISREMAVRGAEYITAHLKKQHFTSKTVSVVLSGSIAVKLPSGVYINMLEEECRKRSGDYTLKFLRLTAPPIAGCINWLLEDK